MSSRTEHDRCVLVYNPVSGHGHLDSWNAILIALLLQKGWRVLALTPDMQALKSRLVYRGIANSPGLQILNWNAAAKNPFNPKERLRHLCRRCADFGHMHLHRLPGSEVRPGASRAKALRVRVLQATVPFLFLAAHYVYRHYIRRSQPAPKVADGNVGEEETQGDLASPMEMALRVQAALRRAKWRPTICLNMYMDLFRTKFAAWRQFEATNQCPWVGIRFVPPETPTEGWYDVQSFRGMLFLDENLCNTYRTALPYKRFEYLPDVTDPSLPDTPGKLVEIIRHRAKGRNVVFLGGSIGGQKNLLRWYELISLADPNEWFFVQVGEIHRSTLTADDIVALDFVLASPPENLLVHVGYLPDDRAFNEVITACDVIFAVYRDFRISSNMLNKAAHFRKPIVVSECFLMGERVRHYGIGKTVAEGSARAMYDALLALVASPIPDTNFAAYSADLSLSACANKLDGFLTGCLSSRSK
jgi:glycosyltransferase involved in cell wall biosynthesis